MRARKGIRDVVEELKAKLKAVSDREDREASARWRGRWRLGPGGPVFTVDSVQDGVVRFWSKGSGRAEMMVGDMEFLAGAGEIVFLGRVTVRSK